MESKKIFTILFLFLSVGLLAVYWFLPYQNFEDVMIHNTIETNNFVKDNDSLGNGTESSGEVFQFYPNLRYREKEIPYNIDSSCSLTKKQEMKKAFEMIENRTILDFYSTEKGKEEIEVLCDEETKEKEGMFVAGEGGPIKIVKSGKYNIIYKGSVLLIRDSNCANPNIAIHELLHALGFDHSENPKNIMYEVSKCYQEIGEDIPEKIDELYSTPGLPDLAFENFSYETHERYLDFNVSVRNIGIKESSETNLNVYVDDKKIKTIEMDPLGPGEGTKYMSKNILIKQLRIEEIRLEIEPEEELDTENNIIILR